MLSFYFKINIWEVDSHIPDKSDTKTNHLSLDMDIFCISDGLQVVGPVSTCMKMFMHEW